jgi:glycosyltransferase involved in cell wall biosynthesis
LKRVLVVAYYFPPIGGIGSIRAAGLARHLPEFGWESIVLAPAETPHPSDTSLLFPEELVIRSRSRELTRPRSAGPLSARRSSEEASSGPRPLYRRAALRLVYPDPQVGWYPGAARVGLRALERASFDAVFSSAFPITAHLVGMKLSRRHELPWVAEFRDPWSERLPRFPYRAAARALERRIARRAARVIMPTPTWAAYHSSLWGVPVGVLGHGYDPASTGSVRGDSSLITHVGSYYPEHQYDLSPLWAAVARINHSAPTRRLRLRWVGEPPPNLRAQLIEAGLGDALEVTGPVSHEVALRLTAESSLLVAAGARGGDPIARGWVPAKLLEYLPSHRSVLFLGDPRSDAAALLRAHAGCFVVEPSDADAIVAAVEGALGTSDHARDLQSISRRETARALAHILDETSAGAP